MTDQQLADFRRFVERCELTQRWNTMGLHRPKDLADLLRPVLDEIDHQRKHVRTLRDELYGLA